MRDNSSRTFRQLLPLYAACYALWFALCAVGLWLLFQARAAIFAAAVQLRFNPWAVRAADQFSTVTFGLIYLVGILVLEHHLRQGVIKNRLWRRAARVFLVEAALLGFFYGVQLLLHRG